MFKYLAGPYSINEDEGICQSLLLTVKRDSYQHRDMASNFGYIPQVGGFAALQKETPYEMFFGKSVSCNVSTCQELNQTLFDLVQNGNIYHCSKEKVKDVWMFLEKNFTPDTWLTTGCEFKQITMEEFKARTDELIKDPYYF